MLGIGLILHGLGNAVLPLRGAADGEPLFWSLSALAIVGFVAAGLGMLHVRPLRRHVAAYALGAGLAALVGHLIHADADLWFGVVLSVTLPTLAVAISLTAAADAPTHHRWWRAAWDGAALAFLAWVAVSTVTFPLHRSWGTHPSEWSLSLPGDGAQRIPAFELQHGVTIEAPPSAVWPWLAQMGQHRAGFYSYDWLERMFGADIHNGNRIVPEWQNVEAGDFVPATQAGYAGGLFGNRPGWLVEAVVPERVLVLRNWGAFVLLPQHDGSTRLVVRSTVSNRRIPAWAAALNLTAFELPHFIMQRRMLLGIKERAEGTARNGAA
jgi:hypothetical protein